MQRKNSVLQYLVLVTMQCYLLLAEIAQFVSVSPLLFRTCNVVNCCGVCICLYVYKLFTAAIL